jgi:hypothetical protein
MLVVAVELQE